MDASEVYPSNWLKAADIGKETPKVTIIEVKPVTITEGEPQKLEVHFNELDKALVLNKTNAGKLIDAFGKETNEWLGKTVELYTALVNYQGNEVPAIRLKAINSPQEGFLHATKPTKPILGGF